MRAEERDLPRGPVHPQSALSGLDSHRGGGSGLVARDRELGELDRIVWCAREGESHVVVVRGEPGIGTSVLLASVLSQTWDLRVLELRGQAEPETLAQKGWPAALLELLVDPTEQSARRALEELVTGSDGPVLLVIDDADCLPRSFLEVLAAAVSGNCTGHPVVLLLAIADVPHCESRFYAGAQVTELVLSGLSFGQSLLLLERAYGISGDLEVTKELVRAANGNPQALLYAFGQLDSDQREGWRPVPHPIPMDRELLCRFSAGLSTLSGSTRLALGAAAAGRVPISVLDEALAHLGLGRSAFEEAAAKGIVVVRKSRIDFAHPLVRAAAYGCLDEADRVRVEQALCRAASAAGMPELAVRHAVSGEMPPAQLVDLYGRAVRAALGDGDTRSAAQHEEMIASLAERGRPAIEHLARAATWWIAAGEVERASCCLDEAAKLGPTANEKGLLSYWRCRVAMTNAIDDSLADELSLAAEEMTDSATRDVVFAHADAALCYLLSGRSVEARTAVSKALDLARPAGGSSEAFATAVDSAIAVLAHSDKEAGDRLRSSTTFLAHQLDPAPVSSIFTYVVGLALLECFGAEGSALWLRFVERSTAVSGSRAQWGVFHLLRAMAQMQEGQLQRAVESAEHAWNESSDASQHYIARRALDRLLAGQSLLGRYREAFVTASKLFAHTREDEVVLRSQAYRWLAELEFQRGRSPLALGWLKAAEFECMHAASAAPERSHHLGARPSWLSTLVVVLAYDAGIEAVRPLLFAVEAASRRGAVHKAWESSVRGLVEAELEGSEELFQLALAQTRDRPVLRAHVEFLYGLRLQAAGLMERAGKRFSSAASLMGSVGAQGWAQLFEQASDRNGVETGSRPDLAVLQGEGLAPTRGSTAAAEHKVASMALSQAGGTDGIASMLLSTPVPERPRGRETDLEGKETRSCSPSALAGPVGNDSPPRGFALELAGEPEDDRLDPAAAFELRMLGEFSIRCDGATVAMPASLAATTLKIVALRRRILADELVEELWPDAAPGVGMRRLRNILWRIRATCGDILVRDDRLLLLSPRAVTDVEIFRRLASQAVDPSTPADKSAHLASSALGLYRGELLPGDRYADWSAASRESLLRTRIQMIELCMRLAIDEERNDEALSLLELLIETDPSEDHYYVIAATLHDKAGNRRRALATLGRGERSLAEYGIRPSARFTRLAAELI